MNTEQLNITVSVIEAAKALHTDGLTCANSGNVSARFGEGLLITPSGVPYVQLSPSDIVWLDLDGRPRPGSLAPSSEWHFHCRIYRDKPDVHGIVHAHSPAATAFSVTRQPLPSFHYMVALCREKNFPPFHIPCCDYQTFGTEALSGAVAASLQGYKACLMANHGMIATGKNLSSAYRLALEVESLCEQYARAVSLNMPLMMLTDDDMSAAFDAFAQYGQKTSNT
ncbi:L-fuculose phosphate aldolase [BD1-7 clade bacterium]|uniref:L-fuculose phosphate aldolase n=1 Tax=BD1-7 clade bacterium TaxID=2029982 RepID=A0A5S9PVE6_9GAMM|nr:L-fuculose phosphate aldolase [BD1-7 clade bacterium]CAA0108994.1 L-fuculose phosphate aldolase [BD1-7 clade bacterium]